MKEKLLNVLKEALEIEDRDLSVDDNFHEYPEWDSLAQLSVIAALDEEFGVIIPGSEFSKLATIGDLLKRIEGS